MSITSLASRNRHRFSKSRVHDFHQLIIQFTRTLSDGPLYDSWDVFPRNIVIPQLGRQAERIDKTAVSAAGQFPNLCEIGRTHLAISEENAMMSPSTDPVLGLPE